MCVWLRAPSDSAHGSWSSPGTCPSIGESLIVQSHPLRRPLLLGLTATVALVTAVQLTKPVFVGRAPVMDLLAAVDSVPLRSPWIHEPTEAALQTSQFLADRQAFADDLLRTGKVGTERAWKIADVAVREAYIRRVPPALVLGVMMTENTELKSTAKSKVGALGLMQVNPKPWSNLAKKFGKNLRADSVNLKYGIFILGYLAGETGRRADQEQGWRSALLRYNGCVTGKNTPNCHRYPDVVRRNVIRHARYSCGGRDFATCVVEPLWLAKREVSSGD